MAASGNILKKVLRSTALGTGLVQFRGKPPDLKLEKLATREMMKLNEKPSEETKSQGHLKTIRLHWEKGTFLVSDWTPEPLACSRSNDGSGWLGPGTWICQCFDSLEIVVIFKRHEEQEQHTDMKNCWNIQSTSQSCITCVCSSEVFTAWNHLRFEQKLLSDSHLCSQQLSFRRSTLKMAICKMQSARNS